MAYPRISKNSAGYARGIIAPLTQQRISCKFPDLKGIGKVPIHSIVYYIMVGESAGTNSLKHLMPHLESVMAVGKIEISNLYKTFLDLLL